MDPIIGGALISGGANLASGIMGGKAADKAAKAQERSQQAALNFAREQEAEQKRRYEQGYGQFNQQTADWYAARNALLGRYGVDISLGSGGLPPGGQAPMAPPPGAAPRAAVRPYQGKTLGQIVEPEAAQMPESRAWDDWSRYNLGRLA